MRSLVSIVIPTYNRVDLLEEAVASCMRQTYAAVEIIIVDDGSTDNTAGVVKKRMSDAWAGASLIYVCQENAGASAARNKGLALAKGTYVQFLDSDDVLMADKLERQVACLESDRRAPEACSCYGRIGSDFHDPGASRRIGLRCETPRDYVQSLCGAPVVHGMQTSAPLWRRSFLAGRPGWRTDISFGDDLEYNVRMLVDARNICFVDRELFWVRIHPGTRLSRIGGSRRQVLSGIAALQSVVDSADRAGCGDRSCQKGALRKARTLYAGLLDLGTVEDLREFESWLWRRSLRPAPNAVMLGLIAVRKCFGRRFLGRLRDAYLSAESMGA